MNSGAGLVLCLLAILFFSILSYGVGKQTAEAGFRQRAIEMGQIKFTEKGEPYFINEQLIYIFEGQAKNWK